MDRARLARLRTSRRFHRQHRREVPRFEMPSGIQGLECPGKSPVEYHCAVEFHRVSISLLQPMQYWPELRCPIAVRHYLQLETRATNASLPGQRGLGGRQVRAL